MQFERIMPNLLRPELGVWCELLAVLGIGTTVAVALAAIVCRRARSAVWELAVWQACTITLLALVTLELTGLGAAAVRVCVARLSEARHAGETEDLALTVALEDEVAGLPDAQLTELTSTLAEPVRTWWPALIWAAGSIAILARMAWCRALLTVFWWRSKAVDDVDIRRRAIDRQSIGASTTDSHPELPFAALAGSFSLACSRPRAA